ncbi:type VI secretion system-associated FHA domain protein TagH [Duganella callida]|uniref:Type VI secretion system-associated FHA domain protein TagH n=1 Tax=Duganella callida TaxID=2561932 RepID=A0A4Y9SG73_9BURK|nr:type VI secretion system-associated FHA domain protein TagH [Duganella callida]TFW20080.1 type VI secretion system-associated FHA domain protein TagH [Duganella callida]
MANNDVTLVLNVLSYRGQPPAEAVSARFAGEGGTLGRGQDSTLVLADPDKYISRQHASVTRQDGTYYFADCGGNPSIVNGQPLGGGASIALSDGDRILIGDYLLQVAMELPPPAPPPAPLPEEELATIVKIPAGFDPLATLLAPVPAPASTAADGAVLQALLNGLGLPALRPGQSPEQLAETVGAMLRAAVGGTMSVLMARALTKRESHIDMTMITAQANNPLKFFPDADSALAQMLGSRIPGYLPPVEALEGAFDDLRAHELAVIAGMRAALAAVVQRFDPHRLEQRMPEPGHLDKLMPAARKARLWDRLTELYADLARDADEDLQRLFGEKFSAAYEQQVARLRAPLSTHP